MKYFTPTHKIDLIKNMLRDLLNSIREHRLIAAKDIATVLGKIASMKKSHGNFVRVLTRQGQHLLGTNVMQNGWDCSFYGDIQLSEELSLICDNIDKFNGHSIMSSLKPIVVFNNQQVQQF